MTILNNVEYHLVSDYQIRAFRPLIGVLPGKTKIVIDTSSNLTKNIYWSLKARERFVHKYADVYLYNH